MPNIRVRIAQISDLHINRKTDDAVVGMLKTILEKEKPHILIVSGDLANQPVPWQMKKAARIVRELTGCCNPLHTIVMPGNHDYKFWGNIGLRRITRIPFEIYFRQNGLELGFMQRFKLGLKLFFNALYWKGKLLREPLIVELFESHPEFGLALFAINSNTLGEMMAAGKVEPSDLQALYRRFDALERSPESRFLYKIAVVHHHPAPIADAPYDAVSRIQDSFMLFYNAGLFVRELSRRGFNLVLHGHKHVAGFVRMTYEFSDQGRAVLPIAAAGTAAHPHPDDSRGHHLNIIDIYDDDTARLEARFFAADTERKDGTCEYDVSSLVDIRLRRYETFRRVQKFSTHEIRKTVSITAEGYSVVRIEYAGNRVFDPEGLAKIPLTLTAERPGYLRGVTVGGASEFVSVKLGKDGLYQVTGEINLGRTRTADDGPFDFSYSYRLMNGHVLTNEEFERHYAGMNLESEFASLACDSACDLMNLRVEFPAEYDLSLLDFGISAEYVPAPLKGAADDRLDWRAGSEHLEETNRMAGNIRREPSACSFVCPEPIPGVRYKLRWRFRSPLPKIPSIAVAQKCEAAKERLLRSMTDPAMERERTRIRAILQVLGKDIAALIKIDESLEIGVMIFDEAVNRLKTVCSSATPLPGGEFASGEGCAGYVFEKTRSFLYHRRRDTTGYFIRPAEWPEVPEMPEPAVLLCFPWVFSARGPAPARVVLGVVNVWSVDPGTALLGLFDLPEDKCIALMKEMNDLANLAAAQLI